MLQKDIHEGNVSCSSFSGSQHNSSSNDEKNDRMISVRIQLTGNGEMHDLDIHTSSSSQHSQSSSTVAERADVSVIKDNGTDIDAETLSSLLTDAAKEAYHSSQQSVLALGLDMGANLGYYYPTADMLFPERFANYSYQKDEPLLSNNVTNMNKDNTPATSTQAIDNCKNNDDEKSRRK